MLSIRLAARLVPLVACAALLTPTARAQDETRVLRVYDVAALLEPSQDHPGPALSLEPSGIAGLEGAGGAEAAFEPDALIQLVRGAVAPDSWGHEATRCEVAGTLLEVIQTAAVHAEVAALLAALRADVTRELEVRARIVRCTAAGAIALLQQARARGGLLAAEAVDAALAAAGGEMLHETTVRGRLGRLTHAAALRQRAFLGDLDVEVAQKAAIVDPITRRHEYGAVIEVRGHALGPDRLALECRCVYATPVEPIRVVEAAGGRIEMPERQVASVGGSVVCAPGDTWVGVAVSPTGGVAFCLTPIRRDAPAAAGPAAAKAPRITRVYRIGALVRRPRDYAAPGLAPPGDSEGAGGIAGLAFGGDESDATAPLTADAVADLLRGNLDPDSWEHPRNRLEAQGDLLLVTHAPAMHDRIAGFLRTLAESRAGGVRVEAALVTPDAALRDLFRGSEPPPAERVDAWLAAAGARVLACAAVGARNLQEVSAWAGRTVPYLGDYEVEVAEEAKIPDPIPGLAREGFALDVRPRLGPEGTTVTLLLAPEWTSVVRPFRTFETPHGAVELPDTTHASLRTEVEVPAGRYAALALGTDASGSAAWLLVRAAPVR